MRGTATTHTTITISSERQGELSFTATPELLELLDNCAFINANTSERFNYSFSGLLLAFIEGRHGISTWFADYVEKSGPDLKAILRYRGLAANMEEIRRGAQDAETSRLYRDGRRTA